MTTRVPSSIARASRRAIFTATIGAVLLVAVPLRPQPAPPTARAADDGRETPAFREEIEVRLVQVPILALDRRGDPVTDLRADEIVVKDRGQRRQPAFLERFVEPGTESEPLPSVALHVDLPGAAERATTSGGAQSRNLILLIDVENDQPLGKERAARDLSRYVEQGLDEAYRVAVLAFDGELSVELAFTRDRAVVAAAIRRAFDRPPRPQIDLQLRVRELIDDFERCVVKGSSTTAPIDSRLGDESCMESVAYDYSDEVRPRAESFLTALEAVVRYAAGLDGRKSAVIVSHGVAVEAAAELREAMAAVFGDTAQIGMASLQSMSGEGARLQLDDLLDLAIRSEVTLHFVDRTQMPAGTGSARQGSAYAPGARPIETAYTAAQTDSQQIAVSTGGTFIASQDLYDGVERAVALESAGYYLGFYTEGYLARDRLTRVSIESTRPGVRIAHSRGTYAAAQGQTAEPMVRGKIALLQPTATTPTRLEVPFQVSADPRDIGYQRVEDSAVANFTFHLIVEDEQGRALADSYHFVNHSYPWSVWQSEAAEPILIGGRVELPAGRYRIVAKFANPRWPDRGGTLQRPLTVGSRAAPPAPAAVPVAPP
jgi:VWFA-related protein